MRPLREVISHIREVAANPAIKTTLIQTCDLIALCDAAESRDALAELISAVEEQNADRCLPPDFQRHQQAINRFNRALEQAKGLTSVR